MEEGRGNVERLTVAALLDLSRPDGAAGPGLTVTEAEEIIKQAVGFKKGRDEIKVNDVKLASGATLEGVEAEYQQAQRMALVLVAGPQRSLGVAVAGGAADRRALLPASATEGAGPVSSRRGAAGGRCAGRAGAGRNPSDWPRRWPSWIDQAETATEQPAAQAAA